MFVRPGVFTSLKTSVIRLTVWPVRIISVPLKEIKKIVFYHRTFNEYMRLRKDVNTLKGRVIGFDEVLRENNRLAKLLNFKRKLIFSSIAANVIGRDHSNWNATMLIDKGLEDGVEIGMPVVDASGVVGKIAEVSNANAKVVLLTDSSFSVAALAQRSRETGLIAGTLEGMCRLRYLSSDADIQVGDQIITSKLSSSFPEGLQVGEVVEVKPDKDGLVLDCIVQPTVFLSQVEEVLVVQKKE